MRPSLSTVFRWLPPLIWMGFIFVGSTDVLSAHHTSRFIEPLLRWLFHGAITPSEIDTIHFLIRKTGHLCEYAMLCVLFWWALRPSKEERPSEESADHTARHPWRRAVFAILLAGCYAATDEFHQSFVPSRGASVEDVLIDTTGAVVGLSLLLAARAAIHSLSQRPKA